jgi:hypothetical protein
MSKKKPDYETLTTAQEVDEEIQKCKDLICKKVKLRGQLKDNKKDAMKGYNDELKIVEEELDFNVAAIDELNRHKKLILAGHQPKAKLQSV